jgi:protein-disulfide isomerase
MMGAARRVFLFSAVCATACGGARPGERAGVTPATTSRVAVRPDFPPLRGPDDRDPKSRTLPLLDAGAEADDSRVRFKIPIGTSPARGSATALVTIVEFADYECPYCELSEGTLRDLRARYGDALRLVFKDAPLPFHVQAEPAAEAALEVRAEKGDAAFWTVHDALFEHARELDTDTIVRLALAAGARADRVREAIARHTHSSEIEADEDIADDFECDGTPYFFIDGIRVAGALPEETFTAILDQEVQTARAQIASGTKPEAIYDALLSHAQPPPEPERRSVEALPAGDPVRGAATAKVSVHEFADFECPFCARAEPTLRKLETRYAGQVSVVWHDLPLPFHEEALPAARAAREARKQGGERAFWSLHDRLLAAGAQLARADLDRDARDLGLDMTRWSTALDGNAHEGEIEVDRHAAEALDLNGTPSFFVVPSGSATGYLLVGAQSYAKFHKLVERALAEAR